MSRSASPPGALDPRSLTPTRLALHHAAQVVSAVGHSLLTPAADDSHRSLLWSDAGSALSSRPLASGHQVGLRLADFEVVVHGPKGDVQARIALDGCTPEDALSGLAEALVGCGAVSKGATLTAPEWDMPPMKGATLARPAPDAAAELARWYGLASAILERVRGARDGASEVILWPHHFDIATLIAIDPDPHAAGARSVGVGVSPGDGTADEPYAYITPYPSPGALPPLEDVEVQSAGWLGYIIRGSTVAG